jgi:hypothetical protein
LRTDTSYLVISNHQSWVDIPALIQALNRRTPFFKFFLKKELIWVPFLGLAWWALDYPFMKRYSKAFLAKHPELAGQDLKITKEACELFKRQPVTVVNYLEGTRFNETKRKQQGSPFKRLLKPKAGGVAFVLAAMGGLVVADDQVRGVGAQVAATANVPLGGDAQRENQLVDLGPGLGDPHHRPRHVVARAAGGDQFEQGKHHQRTDQDQGVEQQQQGDKTAGEQAAHK